MKLSREQKRIVNSKYNGHRLIRGNSGTGKTYSVINRIPVLIKSYCVEDDDKVLLLGLNKSHLSNLKYVYDNLEKAKYEQRSFFDDENDHKLVMKDIDDVVLLLFEQYIKENNFNKEIAHESTCLEYINKAINIVKKEIKNSRKYEKKKIFDDSIIKNEIKFIKESNYSSLHEYQDMFTCDELKLRRNSKDREIVYKILEEYNMLLNNNNLIDYEDISMLALNQAKTTNNKFTHIIIDEVQEFTKIQIDILKEIYLDKSYSSILFTLDNDKLENSKGWLNKKRKFKTLGYNMTGKCINFKNVFEIKEDLKNIENKEIINNSYDIKEENEVFETCKYIDLNRKVCHEFFIDSYEANKIYTSEDKEEVNELVSIPVYNEIAAGSPILMNDELEGSISLPKEWIRASKDVFMLKIKGDSMVNKNINDGDYVVINKMKYPSNYDIVAVEIEGEATLKTFKSKGKTVTLMPENDAYDPIVLTGDRECSLLGVAVGLIKNM